MIELSTKTYAKWILSGEHAVLRGYPALVFPLANYDLELHYQSAPRLDIQASETMQKLLTLLWQKASNPPGILSLKSNIPVGSGLGASAALCLAIAQIGNQLKNNTSDTFTLAKQLENYFHGQSSGLDIIGAGSTQGHYFINGKSSPINMNWRPNWALTYCGEPGHTKIAINQVKQLFEKHPHIAKMIDLQMNESVKIILNSLQDKNNINQLANGMNLAKDCFEKWGLITPKMQVIIDKLFQMGAKAVKPTGSGGGGYLLSLWENPCPDPQSLIINLPSDKKSHSV